MENCESNEFKLITSDGRITKKNLGNKEIIGTDYELLGHSMVHATSAAIPITSVEEHANMKIAIQSIHEMSPKDHLDATLCAQITALDAQGMRYLARAELEKTWTHTETAVNMAIKLLRLKNESIETLLRYRRNGEQRVIVQHINVNDSAKAIIGGVNVQGGGSSV